MNVYQTMRIPVMALALTWGVLAGGMEAHAQSKPNVFDGGNRWLITAYNDTSPVHQQMATQGLCFLPYAQVGTHIQGVWYSDTFPNWQGRYSQEGDRILLHGDYANDVGHDGMVIELGPGTTPRDEGTGQWTEWREYRASGVTIGFTNARLRRAGSCRVTHQLSVFGKSDKQSAETLAAQLSRQVKPRLRRDGKIAESPLDPEQVPLPEETKPEL